MRFLRVDDLDEWESTEAAPQDVGLRRLVDHLDPPVRHVIERVYFGGAALAHAAEEIQMTRPQAERLMKQGLAQLQDWLLNGGPEGDPDRPVDVIHRPHVEQCSVSLATGMRQVPDRRMYRVEWIRCVQPAVAGDDLCAAHLEWAERNLWPDPAYELAVVRGKTPIQAVLTETEMDAVVNGRYKGDGRRLDAYVTADPIGFEP